MEELDLKSRIAGLRVDLQYARIKVHEYGNLPMGGTMKLRDAFCEWNNEVHRLEKELMGLGVKEF